MCRRKRKSPNQLNLGATADNRLSRRRVVGRTAPSGEYNAKQFSAPNCARPSTEDEFLFSVHRIMRPAATRTVHRNCRNLLCPVPHQTRSNLPINVHPSATSLSDHRRPSITYYAKAETEDH
jgi:hypothetical protein